MKKWFCSYWIILELNRAIKQSRYIIIDVRFSKLPMEVSKVRQAVMDMHRFGTFFFVVENWRILAKTKKVTMVLLLITGT